MKKIMKLIVYLNYWRIVPAYVIMNNCRFKEKFLMDLKNWKSKMEFLDKKGNLFAFGFIIIDAPEFRNVILNRLHRNLLGYMIVRTFFKPLDSLYINMPPEKIGGGLYFQHGFSTIVAAKEIGENCHINQQVTIGYNNLDAPIIGDNVTICAGAIVIGKIKLDSNSTIGAGAVVVHDVFENTVVGGVPAKVIKDKN